MLMKHYDKIDIVDNCPAKQGVRLSYYDEDMFSISPCCAYPSNSDDKYKLKVYFKELDDINLLDLLPEYYKKISMLKLCNTCRNLFPEGYKVDFNKMLCRHHYESELLPKYVGVSFLKACNLRCVMCRDSNNFSNKIKQYYFKILNDLKNHNIGLSMTEQGEPFFYKKEVFDFLNTCDNNSFIYIHVLSNLSLLNDNDLEQLRYLIEDKHLNLKLNASIDGLSKEVYENIRRGSNYEKVYHNANYLADRNLLKHINFVIQEKNKHETADFCKYWADRGIPVNLLLENGINNPEYVDIINKIKNKG